MVWRLCTLLATLALAAGAQEPARVSLAPAESGPEWAALLPDSAGLLCARGTVGGLDARILLDPESGMSVIDRELARRLGLRATRRTGEGSGPPFVESIEIGIGSTRLTLARALELDVAEEHGPSGSAPVILGRELFERFVVDIDPAHRRIALRDPADFAYSGAGRTVALRAGAPGGLVVEARVEELPPARFLVDPSRRTLALAPAFTARHALLAERKPASTANEGGAVLRIATLRSFTLADQRFDAVPTVFPGDELAADPTAAGSIGGDVLARFRAIFDLSRGHLHLEPVADAVRPFARDRIGLAAAPRGEVLEVTFVAPGSPAEAGGWKPGDRIVALDGVPLGSADPRIREAVERFARCLESEPGTEVRLTDGTGRVRALVAADYY